MANFKNMFKMGKSRVLEVVEGWPTVHITTFRVDATDGTLFEDTVTLKTLHPPRMGDSVQGEDFQYHKVAVVKASYLEGSPPVYQVTCEAPVR